MFRTIIVYIRMKMLSTTWCLLFILVFSQENDFSQAGCLTWDLILGDLTLICRLPTIGSPVAIYDNNGEIIANCTSQGKDGTCQSFRDDEIISINKTTTEIKVTLRRSRITHYDGQWICQHRTTIYRANVYSLTGIINDTTAELEVVTTTKDTGNHRNVELICSSCRIPYGFNAEFLINNSSIDSVTYDPLSSTCYHGSGVCNPQTCDCSSPGNYFTRTIRVDMSIPKLFSCDMIFVDTYTTAKFSKTSGIYLDGQGFRSIGTITRIIKPGKPMVSTTDKVTNQDLSTVSSNKHSTTQPTSTENKVSDKLLAGLTIVGVITICLLLALVCQCVRVKKTKKKLFNSEKEGRSQLLDTCLLESERNEMTALVHTEGKIYDNKRWWMLAGFLSQIAHKELTLHMKDKMSVLYQKLKNESSVDEQDYSNFLKTFSEHVLNYKDLNENYKNFAEDDTKYDYKIRNAEDLTKVLLSFSLSGYGVVLEYSSLSFEELLYLFNIVDLEMPATVKSEVFKIQTSFTDWFSSEENVWTEEKVSSQIESVQLIAEYTQRTKRSDIGILRLEGADIFDNPRYQVFIGAMGSELDLFVKRTKSSFECCVQRRIHALLKDNNAYNEFLKRRRFEEISIYKLTKLIMEIGMTVVKNYISSHVLPQGDKDFESFLNQNKHKLFHAWHNKKRCCQCNRDFTQNDQCDLTREQYELLFCLKDKAKRKPLHLDSTGRPLKDANEEHSPNHDKTSYCICNIVANRDVTLDAIDFTIALCIMMHCTSTKESLNGKEQHITPSILEGTKNIRNCRNMIIPTVTTHNIPLEKYQNAWEEMEKTLTAMSKSMGTDFHKTIEDDIQSLKYDESQCDNFKIADVLKQCKQDIKLSINQECEKSFVKTLNKIELITLCNKENLSDQNQSKEWKASKGNTVLNIKRYPFIPDDNLPVYEVLIDVDAPIEWDVDDILETIRNQASSIGQRCSVQITETTLEDFKIIVEIDASHYNQRVDIEIFLWDLLESCNVDLCNKAVLDISMKILGSKLKTSFNKPLPRTNDDKRIVHTDVDSTEHQDFTELKLLVEKKIATKKDPFFTSAEVWSDDEFIFVESHNSSLIFFNFKTGKERVIRLSSTPFSMAVMEDGIIAMSFPDKRELRISNVKKETISDIDIQKMEGKCYTLTKQDAETVLVSVEELGIYSYNIRNKKLKKLGIHIPDFVPSSDELFFRASKLVHTCRAEGSLHCYDVNGKSLWKYSDVLNNPTTITLDAYGNVFASDLVSNKLYHIVPDGSSHTVLLSRKDNIRLPSCLYFCEKRKWLLIVNRDNGYFFCYEVLYK